MLIHRLDKLISQYDRADAIRNSFIHEKGDLMVRLSDLETYLHHHKEVTEVLTEIQTRMHSGTTETYERLLTELLHLVMPDDPANDRVVMSHYVKNNTVALKTEVQTRDGYLHDVYENKGRSVENILALCLRFLALGRTANRRLLLFDEPDHGIMPAYMGNFAEVLYQLTYRVGMQVIYISHHDWKLFEGKARIIRLDRDGDSIQANVVSDSVRDQEVEGVFDPDLKHYMEGVGITDVTLKDYKAHINTHLELSPFLNVIIGPMDLGKSTILSAITSLNQNNGTPSRIRNGQRAFEVEIGLEGGHRLNWNYSLDRNKKSHYLLVDDEGHEVASHEGSKPPAFLDTYLAMPLHHGYDLHVADEHDSSFVFAKGVSETRAAEILSFDEDTTHAQELLAQHKDNIANYRKEMKLVKANVNKVKNKLEVLSLLNDVDIDYFRQARDTLRDNAVAKAPELHELAKHIRIQQQVMSTLSQLSAIGAYPERPESATWNARALSTELQKTRRISQELNRMTALQPHPSKPAVDAGLRRTIQQISKGRRILRAEEALDVRPYAPRPVRATDAAKYTAALKEEQEALASLKEEGDTLSSEIERINHDLKGVIHQKGGLCPLCKSKM